MGALIALVVCTSGSADGGSNRTRSVTRTRARVEYAEGKCKFCYTATRKDDAIWCKGECREFFCQKCWEKSLSSTTYGYCGKPCYEPASTSSDSRRLAALEDHLDEIKRVH